MQTLEERLKGWNLGDRDGETLDIGEGEGEGEEEPCPRRKMVFFFFFKNKYIFFRCWKVWKYMTGKYNLKNDKCFFFGF